MPERFKAQAQRAVGTLFAMSAEFLIAGEYQREGVALAQPKFLVMPVRPEWVDGTIVQPNDELFAVRRGGADGCGRAASRGLRGVGDRRFVAQHQHGASRCDGSVLADGSEEEFMKWR